MKEREARGAAELTAARILESEAEVRFLFENALDAILLILPDGTVTGANPAACALFGMTQQELCHAGRQGLTDPADSRWKHAIESRARTGRVSAELSFLRKDGTGFTAETSSVVIEGQPPRRVCHIA